MTVASRPARRCSRQLSCARSTISAENWRSSRMQMAVEYSVACCTSGHAPALAAHGPATTHRSRQRRCGHMLSARARVAPLQQMQDRGFAPPPWPSWQVAAISEQARARLMTCTGGLITVNLVELVERGQNCKRSCSRSFSNRKARTRGHGVQQLIAWNIRSAVVRLTDLSIRGQWRKKLVVLFAPSSQIFGRRRAATSNLLYSARLRYRKGLSRARVATPTGHSDWTRPLPEMSIECAVRLIRNSRSTNAGAAATKAAVCTNELARTEHIERRDEAMTTELCGQCCQPDVELLVAEFPR